MLIVCLTIYYCVLVLCLEVLMMPNRVNCLPNHILLCPGIMPGSVDDTK